MTRAKAFLARLRGLAGAIFWPILNDEPRADMVLLKDRGLNVELIAGRELAR